MFFTQDDYRKIEEWLRTRTVKDSEFPHADPLRGNEDVPIIQDGKNKTLTIDELVKQVAMMELPDFFNVTTFAKKGNLFLEEAINCIPVEQRKLGLTITFHSAKGHWLIYQFKGTSLNQWCSLNYWRSPIEEALEELVFYPDEEDITGVRDGNRTFLKFKDKDYDPADFSGMGRIMLRKNLVGTEACSLDDEDHLLNILTQDMIREENTVYIVQYDFDLDGKAISIPKGCTLWFQGGSINNGTIYLEETAILGAFEFADMGNAKLFGKFNTGQVMTFSDDSYKAKTGGYFVAGTKPSSATVAEDAKNEGETFYDKNPNVYTTQERQELRWWNGEEWILTLDITDYNEIKSIINDLIEKHNAEMSACYKYFKARMYALELRMDGAESDITNIKKDITDITGNITDILNQISSLNEVINNIENLITEQIENYIANNVIGIASVTVNGQKYDPDEDGNITLPDYPQPGGGTADKVAGKLKFTGASNAEYDGSKDVEVNIPATSGSYNPNGTTASPVVLCATELARSSIRSVWEALGPIKNEHIESLSCNLDNDLLKVTLNMSIGWRISRAYAIASIKNLSEVGYSITAGTDTMAYGTGGIQCGLADNIVYLHAWEPQNGGTIKADGLGTQGHCDSINLIIIGYIEEKPIRTITVTLNSGVESITVRNETTGNEATYDSSTSFIATNGDLISWEAVPEAGFSISTSSGSFTVVEDNTIAPTAIPIVKPSEYFVVRTSDSTTLYANNTTPISLDSAMTMVIAYSDGYYYHALPIIDGEYIQLGDSQVNVGESVGIYNSIDDSARIGTYTVSGTDDATTVLPENIIS